MSIEWSWKVGELGAKQASLWGVRELGAKRASLWGVRELGTKRASLWEVRELGAKRASLWGVGKLGAKQASLWGVQRKVAKISKCAALSEIIFSANVTFLQNAPKSSGLTSSANKAKSKYKKNGEFAIFSKFAVCVRTYLSPKKIHLITLFEFQPELLRIQVLQKSYQVLL